MPDITMCQNSDCPIKDKCYRYTAKPNMLQSYSIFQYKDGNCDYFIDTNQKKEVKNKSEKQCRYCANCLIMRYYSGTKIAYCTKIKDKQTIIGYKKVKLTRDASNCPSFKKGKPKIEDQI